MQHDSLCSSTVPLLALEKTGGATGTKANKEPSRKCTLNWHATAISRPTSYHKIWEAQKEITGDIHSVRRRNTRQMSQKRMGTGSYTACTTRVPEQSVMAGTCTQQSNCHLVCWDTEDLDSPWVQSLSRWIFTLHLSAPGSPSSNMKEIFL